MSNPKQGTFYTVEYGDDLRSISRRAFGYDRSLDLIRSNSAMLQPRIAAGRIHSNLGGIPIVYKGDVLWIPPLGGEDKPDIAEDSPFEENVTIKINGKNLRGFVTNSIERSMNSIADSFSFTASYNIDDLDSRNLDPYLYYPVELYIAGGLFMTGILEHWKPNIGAGTIDITARTKAGQVVDCNSPSMNLNYIKQSFKQIADSILQPFGVILETPYGDTGIINIAKRETTDKVFDFLAKLAQSKGFILNSSIQGNIRLDRANVSGQPILNLVEGEPNIIDIDAGYDGTQRFSSFKAISQTRGNPNNSNEVKDSTVKINRPIIFSADNNEQGDIKNAALWERARSLARSAPVNVKISGWKDKNNKIILENNTVTLYAPRACIFTETKYLIEKVNFSQDGGKSASLSLVLPQAYSLDFPEVLPWLR